MSKKLSHIFIAIVVLVLVAAGIFVYLSNKSDSSYFSSGGDGVATKNFEQQAGTFKESAIYTHPFYGFNITLPAGFSTGNFEEGEGDVVLIQPDSSYKSDLSHESYRDYSMQIYITPFEGEESITLQKVHSDIPDLEMRDPLSVEAGGVPAATFIDTERNTREVWFSYGGNLYQITSKPEFDNITGSIMESWEWQ